MTEDPVVHECAENSQSTAEEQDSAESDSQGARGLIQGQS